MHAWTRDTVVRFGFTGCLQFVVLLVAILLGLAIAAAFEGCCQTYLRRDDSAPAAQRYYEVRECPWGVSVLCQSPAPLPTDPTEGNCK